MNGVLCHLVQLHAHAISLYFCPGRRKSVFRRELDRAQKALCTYLSENGVTTEETIPEELVRRLKTLENNHQLYFGGTNLGELESEYPCRRNRQHHEPRQIFQPVG